MASILLSGALSGALSPSLGMIAPVLGLNIGSSLGGIIDNKLFGTPSKEHKMRYRLSDLMVQTSCYGKVIPEIYGTVRVAGNIIWSSDIREAHTRRKQKVKLGKGQKMKHIFDEYKYYASFAISICKGKINEIIRTWADDELIDISEYNYRLYLGTEDQMPDPIIEGLMGYGKTPAYRDQAYIAFENFPLEKFGNRIPNFNFEVKKIARKDSNNAEQLVNSVMVIPGSGEFVYSTDIHYKSEYMQKDGQIYNYGKLKPVNMNNHYKEADAKRAFMQMLETFPNLKWIGLSCAWFADNLDISKASIYPAVEYNHTSFSNWNCAGISRENARVVSKDNSGELLYGGTPSDETILEFIDMCHSHGIKVMFYPIIMMDMNNKPWRGRMIGKPEDVKKFFEKSDGYNRFILHYANLLKGKVDAFSIGTELKGITAIKDDDNNFTAVKKLADLAMKCKKILNSKNLDTNKDLQTLLDEYQASRSPDIKGCRLNQTNDFKGEDAQRTNMYVSTAESRENRLDHLKMQPFIIYAADWSEYHHEHNGWYHMDELWACNGIDFIGIDAYFPLTEKSTSVYDINEIIHGFKSGLYYDYYYDTKGKKIKLEPRYAIKNLQWFYENEHINPDGRKTAWKPRMKKIWITEYGFPSVQCASNEPNLFYDPSSNESGFPKHSNGGVDFLAQRTAIYAAEKFYKNLECVDNNFLWCYDARPFPSWPDNKHIWSDTEMWLYGHWTNGKLGTMGLADLILEICSKHGIKADVSRLYGTVDGVVTSSYYSVKDFLRMLSKIYLFDIFQSGDKLCFVSKSNYFKPVKIGLGDILESGINIERDTSNLASSTELSYYSKNNSYAESIARSNVEISEARKFTEDANSILPDGYAKELANIITLSNNLGANIYKFSLPSYYMGLEIGSYIDLENHDLVKISKISIGADYSLEIAAYRDDPKIYKLLNSNYVGSMDEYIDHMRYFVVAEVKTSGSTEYLGYSLTDHFSPIIISDKIAIKDESTALKIISTSEIDDGSVNFEAAIISGDIDSEYKIIYTQDGMYKINKWDIASDYIVSINATKELLDGYSIKFYDGIIGKDINLDIDNISKFGENVMICR